MTGRDIEAALLALLAVKDRQWAALADRLRSVLIERGAEFVADWNKTFNSAAAGNEEARAKLLEGHTREWLFCLASVAFDECRHLMAERHRKPDTED